MAPGSGLTGSLLLLKKESLPVRGQILNARCCFQATEIIVFPAFKLSMFVLKGNHEPTDAIDRECRPHEDRQVKFMLSPENFIFKHPDFH